MLIKLKRSEDHCVLQARRKGTEDNLKRALRGQFDDEKTQQGISHDNHAVVKSKWVEALLERDQQIVAMQTVIKENKMKIRHFQETNLRKARQISAFQAALNKKERECKALQEGKEVELKALKVLLVEKEKENAEMKARLQKWDQDVEVSQLVEETEPSLEDVSKNGVEGDLAHNQGEELLQTKAQNGFIQNVEAQTGEEFSLTEVTLPAANILPVESFPETVVSDANGNMICLSSDTVEVEIFSNILSYGEQVASDQVEAKTEDANKCRQCGLKFLSYNQLRKHLKQMGHKSLTDCNVCKKKFTNKYTLKGHKEQVHGSETSFAHTKCEKKFTSKISLKSLEEQMHSSKTPFACTKCGQRFKGKERWRRHEANEALHQRLERL